MRAKLGAAALAVLVLTAPVAAFGQAPPPAPASPPPAAVATPPLVPGRGDPSEVDEVILPRRPVLLVSGSGSWDDGLKTLRADFDRLRAELARLGIAPAGRPLALYTEALDDTFRYDAMIPIAAIPIAPSPPAPAPSLPVPEMRFAATPSGKAYRFVHRGAYEAIDPTYETIITYLAAKDIVASDAFVEEFLDDIADPADPKLEVNIYVQPK